MFAFVSAFPKSLHCTDEAQQAETVLSAVLSITLLLLRAGEIPDDISCTKAVLSASPGPTPKRCELQLFLAALGQVICRWKELDLRSLNMQFQHDWPKDKKITVLLIFWPENLEKFRSSELHDAPLEGSKIFLHRSSTGRTPLDSSGLAELKYAFFSRTQD